MSPMSYFDASPTVVLTPQHFPDQYFHEAHYRPAQPASTPGVPTPCDAFNSMTMSSLPPTPGSLAGRKRSRDAMTEEEEPQLDGSSMPAQATQDYLPPQADPTYGPGMTLVYPNDPSGYPHSKPASPTRPIVSSRKSQRLDASSGSPSDTINFMPSVPSRAPGSEPLIDEATRMLGISWVRMDGSEVLQIAQRAYTRWIKRHYPMLTNVELWFENNAIPAYLGHATNQTSGLREYYLWSQDLHQAILVTRQPGDLILKLSQPHMSLSQAAETLHADLEPVVESCAANAAILRNDPYIIDDADTASGGMEVD